jgi:hypothetical protein
VSQSGLWPSFLRCRAGSRIMLLKSDRLKSPCTCYDFPKITGGFMTTESEIEYQRRLREKLIAVGGFILGGALAAPFTHVPGSSSDWAAWAQALGTVGAIAGAYWIGERQMRDTTKRELRAKAERFKAYLAIATIALMEARRVDKAARDLFDRPFSAVQFAASEEWAKKARESLIAIPMHEWGTASAIHAVHLMSRALDDLQALFEQRAPTIARPAANALYPSASMPAFDRSHALDEISAQVKYIEAQYNALDHAIQINIHGSPRRMRRQLERDRAI